MMGPRMILELANVSVRYTNAPRPVLDGCSLRITQGERVALFGLNGSGKTSMLLAIAGILPHHGSIAVDGLRLTTASVGDVRKRIGFLFANPDDQLLFPRVQDDVEFSLVGRGEDRDGMIGKARSALDAMGVRPLAESAPYLLSHGQKVRVALAGALVHDPPLLLLDEPSSALDPPARRALAAALRAQHGAMLMATHDQVFTRTCCTRFVLLEGGRIVKDTMDPEEIRL